MAQSTEQPWQCARPARRQGDHVGNLPGFLRSWGYTALAVLDVYRARYFIGKREKKCFIWNSHKFYELLIFYIIFLLHEKEVLFNRFFG